MIDRSNTWSKDLILLLSEFPWIRIEAMGYEKGWQLDPFWLGVNLETDC